MHKSVEKWPLKFQYLCDSSNPLNYNCILNIYELKGILSDVFNNNVAFVQIIHESLLIIQNSNIVSNSSSLANYLNNYNFTKFYSNFDIYNIFSINIDDIHYGYLLSFIDFDSKQIDTFLSYLNKKLILIQEDFIRRKNEEFISSIKTSISKITKYSYKQGFSHFWIKIENTLNLLINTYPAKHVGLFAIKNIYSFEEKTLDLVASVGIHKESYKLYSYRTSNIDLNYSGEMITSKEHPSLLNNLYKREERETLDPTEDLIRILPAPFSKEIVIVIWVRYDNDIWPRLKSDDAASPKGILFHNLITSFYTVLVSTYSSLLSSQMLEIIETAWRILSHETGQISAGIERLRNAYLENIRIKYSTIEEIQDINKNLKGLLEQYNYLSLNTRALILKRPDVVSEDFYLFGEFFFKWKNIYNLSTSNKKINFVLPTDFKGEDRPKITADRLLLEQVLYNLINNAVKYGREGTNIYIDYYADYENYIIDILNYSSKIEDESIIWELFGRDANNPEDGLGIGLFITKEIVKALNGKIKLEQTKISKYNISLLYPYIALNQKMTVGPNLPSIEDAKSELSRLKSNGNYDKVVFQKKEGQVLKPGPKVIINGITKPTYAIMFKILLKR